MPSMRVICSGVSASSFLKRSDCHHLPCAAARPGTPSTIADNIRQMNNLRRVFIFNSVTTTRKLVFTKTGEVITRIGYFRGRKPGRSARVVDEGQFGECAQFERRPDLDGVVDFAQ